MTYEMFGTHKIHMVTVDGEPWFKAKDITKALGYRDAKQAVRDNTNTSDKQALKELIGHPGKYNQNDLKTKYLNKHGVICLLCQSKLPNKDAIIDWFNDKFNLNIIVVTRLYKEQETIGQLAYAFSSTSCLMQYSVGSYRVDLYLPEYKLVIECDEIGHRDRDQTYEAERQKYIENALNCEFIRFNPDEPSFNIFHVISWIVDKIRRKQINLEINL